MKQYVYNLQFFDYCNEFTVSNHVFKRIDDYEERFKRLSHHISYCGEIEFDVCTGENVVTATVESPTEEAQSPLGWTKQRSILNDVLLVLSLFTGRDIFASEFEQDSRPIVRDARPYIYYETLAASIPTTTVLNEKNQFVEVGFEETLEKTLRLIHSQEWLNKYEGGSVLFIARQIFTFQILEKAFLMAYVLWEHIFYMEKRLVLDEEKIKSTDGADKVRFLLQKYQFTAAINGQQKKCIQRFLTDTRNHLAHYGLFKTDPVQYRDAVNFVELTTRLIAKVLQFEPKDARNTNEWLQELLARNPDPEINIRVEGQSRVDRGLPRQQSSHRSATKVFP